MQLRIFPQLCFLVMVLAFSTAAQAMLCRHLSTKIDPRSYDPKAVLQRAGYDIENVTLDFKKYKGGDEAPSWEMVIQYHSKTSKYPSEIGHMTVWALDGSFAKNSTPTTGWKDYHIWRTDTSGVAFQGKGLGQLMYLLMAAKFYSSYPQKHLISMDHSGSANKMWEALVAKGFASKFSVNKEGQKIPISEELGVIYEINKRSLNKSLKDFVRKFPLKPAPTY
jgi:hypothetical protein